MKYQRLCFLIETLLVRSGTGLQRLCLHERSSISDFVMRYPGRPCERYHFRYDGHWLAAVQLTRIDVG